MEQEHLQYLPLHLRAVRKLFEKKYVGKTHETVLFNGYNDPDSIK